MQWEDYRQSDNLEDRRGSGGGGGFAGMPGGRGGVGIGTMVVLGLLGWALGIDPRLLIGGAELIGGIGGRPQTQETRRSSGPPQDEMGRFVSAVLAQNEDVWSKVLPQQANTRYQPPRLVLFSGVDRSGCGTAQAAMGPFYCPMDRQVYLDLGFWNTMSERLGAEGDFAQAYVIAHEVGHHVQTLEGTADRVRQAQSQARSQAEANRWQVAMELQADCYAGVWAARVGEASGGQVTLEPGDIEEGLNAASRIGDDVLSGGQASPESFTHGSSEQRVEWLRRGLQSGDPAQCDTFGSGGGSQAPRQGQGKVM